MPNSPEQPVRLHDSMIGDIFSRRAFIAAGITSATSLVLSSFNSIPDNSCYIGGAKRRQKNRIGIGKMFQCTINDPIVRVNAGLLIGLGVAIAASQETSS